jgi:hypothetical protein
MVQAQRPDLVILDRLVHGRHSIALVELTCPWNTDAKRAEEHKTADMQASKLLSAMRGVYYRGWSVEPYSQVG